MAQHRKMVKAFASILEIQRQWKSYEHLLLLSSYKDRYNELLPLLSDLYSLLVDFQARAICMLSKGNMSRAWQNITGASDWVAKENDIVTRSDQCMAMVKMLQQGEIRDLMDRQWESSTASVDILTRILDHVREGKREELEMTVLHALASVGGQYRAGKDFNRLKTPGTCNWFLNDRKFTSWLDSLESRVLWVTAGAGCGKSVLARSLIDEGHLSTTTITVETNATGVAVSRNTGASVCYFFFKEGDSGKSSLAQALCAMLHQLFAKDTTSTLIQHAVAKYKIYGEHITSDSAELWQILEECASVSSQGSITCVFDALDECQIGYKELVDHITQLLEQGRRNPTSCCIKILITSRPYDLLKMHFAALDRFDPYIHFEADDQLEQIIRDIDLVIDTRLPEIATGFDPGDYQRIAARLKSTSNRTYLWLKLTFDIIESSRSEYGALGDIENLLSSLPSEVVDAYEIILSKRKDTRRTTLLFEILLAATRTLSLSEANFALAFALCDSSKPTLAEIQNHLVQSDFKSAVKNLCGLLVTVHHEQLFFIHLTAREFLLAEREPGKTWKGKFDLAQCHSTWFIICMKNLLISTAKVYTFGAGRLDWYAIEHWATHYEAQDESGKTRHRSIVQELCNNSAIKHSILGTLQWECPSFGTSKLQMACFLGLSSIVTDMIRQGININDKHGTFGTALHAAVAGNRVAIAAILLDNGADFSARSPLLGNVLANAALHSSSEMFPLLAAHNQSLIISEHLMFKETYRKHWQSRVIWFLEENTRSNRVSDAALTIAASMSSILVKQQLQQHTLAGLRITERMLINATTSNDPIETMSTLLEFAGDEVRVTEDVVGAAAASRTSIELLEYLFKRQRQRLDISQNMCKAVIYHVQRGETLKLFLNVYAPDIDLTQSILPALHLSSIHPFSKPFVLFMLQIYSNRPKMPEDWIISESYSNVGRTDIMEVLLAHIGHRFLATSQLVRAVSECLQHRNISPGFRKCFDLLVSEYRAPDLLTSSAICVIVARFCSLECIKTLMEDPTSNFIPTAELFLAAAENHENQAVMELIAQKTGHRIPATPDVLKSVAKNRHTPLDFLKQLITQLDENISEWEEVICAIIACRHDIKQSLDMLQSTLGSRVGCTLRTWAATLSRQGAMREPVAWMLENIDRDLLLESMTDDFWANVALARFGRDIIEMIERWRPGTFRITPTITAAVAYGNTEVLDYLANEYQHQIPETFRQTMFDVVWFRAAVERDDVSEARRLLNRGTISLTLQDGTGDSLLHKVIYYDASVEMMRMLLEQPGVDINAVGRNGRTLLYGAALHGRNDMVALLLDAGADPYLKTASGGTLIEELKYHGRFYTSIKLMEDRSTWF